MFPPNTIPMHPGAGAMYQPPFPQPRMPQTGLPFLPAFSGPDWFNVFDSNIYGSGKIDINIIVRIVSADKKLRHLVQGQNSSCNILLFLLVSLLLFIYYFCYR